MPSVMLALKSAVRMLLACPLFAGPTLRNYREFSNQDCQNNHIYPEKPHIYSKLPFSLSWLD